MRKIELNTKLRSINRNKAITTYVKDKFKADKPLIMPVGNEFKSEKRRAKMSNYAWFVVFCIAAMICALLEELINKF